MSDPAFAGAILTIDLDAIVDNWRQLAARVAPAGCAAVVKADAYGLGADRVVPALAAAGCATFFVATVEEAIAVRSLAPDAPVYVLNGAPRGAEAVLAEYRLSPVLNSLGDVDAWADLIRRQAAPPAALHVDTGMSRLGLPAAEMAALADDPSRLEGIDLACVMSHLACADEPDHPLNEEQRLEFDEARRSLPAAPASFANSSGVFLGAAYHLDLARPGVALYGGTPVPDHPNPMVQVVELKGRIVQVREIDSPRTVGYGASHRVDRRTQIATVAVGYADGFLRSLSNAASGFIGAHRVPLVGRVSMDLITFDVTHVPEDEARPGAFVHLIDSRRPVDAVAADAGTIGYEVLTSLGRRYHRIYRGGGS